MVQPAHARRLDNSVVVQDLVNWATKRGTWEKDLDANKERAANGISEFLILDTLNKMLDRISPFHILPSSDAPLDLECSFDLTKNCIQIRTWSQEAADRSPFSEFFAHFEEAQPAPHEDEAFEVSECSSNFLSRNTPGKTPDINYFQGLLAKVCHLVQHKLQSNLSAIAELTSPDMIRHEVKWYRRAEHYLPNSSDDNQLTISLWYEKNQNQSHCIDLREFSKLPENIQAKATELTEKLNNRADTRRRWERALHSNTDEIAHQTAKSIKQVVLGKMHDSISPFYVLPTSSSSIKLKFSLDTQRNFVAIQTWTQDAADLAPLDEWLPFFENQHQLRTEPASVFAANPGRVDIDYFHEKLAKVWHSVEKILKDKLSKLNDEINSAPSQYAVPTIQYDVTFYRQAETLLGSSTPHANDNVLTASIWVNEPKPQAAAQPASSSGGQAQGSRLWCVLL